MKKIALIIGTVAILVTGCVSTPTPEQQAKLARLTDVIKIATYTSSAIWMSDHPQDFVRFQQARTAIATLLMQDTIDPSTLATTLAVSLPIKELRSEKAGIIVTGALLLYQSAVQTQELRTPAVVRACAEGIVEGLDIALAIAP